MTKSDKNKKPSLSVLLFNAAQAFSTLSETFLEIVDVIDAGDVTPSTKVSKTSKSSKDSKAKAGYTPHRGVAHSDVVKAQLTKIVMDRVAAGLPFLTADAIGDIVGIPGKSVAHLLQKLDLPRRRVGASPKHRDVVSKTNNRRRPPPNRRLPENERNRRIALLREIYNIHGPLITTDISAELRARGETGAWTSRKALYKWMLEAGIPRTMPGRNGLAWRGERDA